MIEETPGPFATSNGLAVFRFGDGEPLLFMPYPHGLGVVGRPRTMALLRTLAGLDRTLVTFDPPASGRSTRPAHLGMEEMLACAEEALDVCEIGGPVDVLGHSQGGVAALALAVEHPQRVRRLLLVATASGGPTFLRSQGAIWNRSHPRFWRFALLASLQMAWPGRGAETLMNNLIFRESFVDRRLFAPDPIVPRDWFRPRRPRTAWSRRVAWRLDYRCVLETVRAPTLVLAGRFDPQMPLGCSEELARRIPLSELVVFERSGHYPFIEEPAAFSVAVTRFLGRQESQR